MDDMLCVAHLKPNVLATGSCDGSINLYNLGAPISPLVSFLKIESGHVRHRLLPPSLEAMSADERAVEGVVFVRATQEPLLFSGGGDGVLRTWRVSKGRPLHEFVFGAEEGTAMSPPSPHPHARSVAMAADADDGVLVAGDHSGVVHVLYF